MAEPPRIGVIGIPGKWSTETLADAVEARSGFRLVIDLGRVMADLADGRLWFGDQDLCALDGLLVKKASASYSPNTLDRLELLRLAESSGVRVFSRAERILRLIDRLSCTMTLHIAGIPMPATRVTEDPAAALDAVRAFGSAVFKPLYSTKARGMQIISESDADAERMIRDFRDDNPIMYIQQRIDLPGRDLGLVFLAGHYLGAYARVPNSDAWNTTIHSGGRYQSCEPGSEIVELARRAQQPFGMDFTTVDVAETDAGPVVFEVSAFGGFRGAKEGIGINAAELYVAHVLKEIGND